LLKEQRDISGAQAAIRKAIDSGYADAVDLAAYLLGLLLEKQGDLAGAQAIDLGDSESAGSAPVNLGALLEKQGDISGAQAAYQQAIASCQPDASSVAARALEDLRRP
jgi:tetratricopeptide (TPR) repeat protein